MENFWKIEAIFLKPALKIAIWVFLGVKIKIWVFFRVFQKTFLRAYLSLLNEECPPGHELLESMLTCL